MKLHPETSMIDTMTRRLPLSTGDDSCINLAGTWLQDCVSSEDHSACRAASAASAAGGGFRPKRLLFVGSDLSSGGVRLHLTTPADGNVEYLALSHCWGCEDFFTLTSATHDEMLTGVNCDMLPQNFRDAIDITRRLGFSYIWIDSLCIIQGSSGDWEEHSRDMSNIYSRAVCTIASSGSAAADGGCYHDRNRRQFDPCVLLSSEDQDLAVQLGSPNPFIADVERGTLSERAWAFQERLLSRRTLYFGASQILFECATHTTWETLDKPLVAERDFMSEDGQRLLAQELDKTHSMSQRTIKVRNKYWGGKSRHKYTTITNPAYVPTHFRTSMMQSQVHSSKTAFRLLLGTPQTSGSPSGHVADWRLPEHQIYAWLPDRRTGNPVTAAWIKRFEQHRRWFQLVQTYTSARLTQPSDRTVAMRGIVQALGGDGDGAGCRAGLWDDHLFFDLLWCLETAPSPRPTQTRAPTWSWMSVDGTVCQMLLSSTAANKSTEMSWHAFVLEAKVVDFQSRARSTEINGTAAEVYEGHLDIEGSVSTANMASMRPTMFSRNNEHTLEMTSGDETKSISFYPDIDLSGTTGGNEGGHELLCLRILSFASGAHGLVLRKSPHLPTPEQPLEMYERVGRFKINEWSRRLPRASTAPGYGTVAATRRRLRIV